MRAYLAHNLAHSLGRLLVVPCAEDRNASAQPGPAARPRKARRHPASRQSAPSHAPRSRSSGSTSTRQRRRSCSVSTGQIQMLDRIAPVLPLLPGMPARMTHGYVCSGTTILFAALDPTSGSVITQARPTTLPPGVPPLPQIDRFLGPDELRSAARSWTTTPPTKPKQGPEVIHLNEDRRRDPGDLNVDYP